MFLAVVPWSQSWDDSLALLRSTLPVALLRSGYVRGGLSAVGVIHLAWGVLEALGAARAARAARGPAREG